MSVVGGLTGQRVAARQLQIRPLAVQGQQPAQDFLVGHLRRVVGPAVGSGDCNVERFVGLGEPGGALVVELGQRAGGELLLEAVARQDAVGVRTQSPKEGPRLRGSQGVAGKYH